MISQFHEFLISGGFLTFGPRDKLRQEEDVATAGYHVFMDYEAVKLGIHWSQFSITN